MEPVRMNGGWNEPIGGKAHFDVSLFEMTREKRIELYDKDPIEVLNNMTYQERMEKHGQDYGVYLSIYRKSLE